MKRIFDWIREIVKYIGLALLLFVMVIVWNVEDAVRNIVKILIRR